MTGDNINNNKESSKQLIESNCNVDDAHEYHAVFIPNNPSAEHVYTNKLKALEVMKSNIKSDQAAGRLKTFKLKSDAEIFAAHGGDILINEPISSSNPKEGSNFVNPKCQELVVFRKLIEEGDLDSVKQIIWQNPRYLISSGDTPSILQIGFHYNALHVISSRAHRNHAKMCQLILQTINDPKFIELYYGDDNKCYIDRAQILLDLYLNTPDKGLNETPLHFAAKFALKDVVKVLISYPQCVKTVKNKHGQTVFDVVCSRKGQELKEEIMALLEDQYYVPVLRADDNTLPAKIGQLFSPQSPPQLNEDKLCSKIEIKAFAGPMSKPQATEFRKKWKTPPRMDKTPNKLNVSFNGSFTCLLSPNARGPQTRFQDSEKGLEVIGRDLAKEYDVPWKEYWPFLKDFADLRCDEGLQMFENYLSNKTSEMITLKSKNQLNTNGIEVKKINKNSVKNLLNQFTDDNQNESKADKSNEKGLDEMDILVKKLEIFSLDDTAKSTENVNDEFYTPPVSPSSSPADSDYETSDDEMVLAETGTPLFIDGENPDKIDFDVFHAIPDNIDADIYPFIYKWKHEMGLVLRDESLLSINFKTPKKRLILTPL